MKDWFVFRPALLVWLMLAMGFAAPALAATGARYDVSYVWAGRLDNVYDYKRRVGHLLGSDVSRKLRVVRRSGLYGLIYYRRGDSRGAAKVARVHSRLLRNHGLDAAAPIRSRDWTFVTPGGAPTGTASAKSSSPPSPPPASSKIERLPDIGDLSDAVDRQVKKLRRQGVIAPDERTAWSVFDFTTGKKLVGINEDVQFQAASMIKPFLALAFFHRVGNDELIYGPRSRRHMERMIRYSNNRSTNWVMRHLGGPRGAQAILERNYPEIFKNTSIVEYIPAGGRTYRNKASAHDYSRFLYALWNESIPGAKEIKRLMGLPGPDRLHTGVDAIPDGTLVYNKTGSTARLCGDIGIIAVKGKDGRLYAYTMIGIIEKQGRAKNYASWIRSRGDVIRRVSNLVFTGISRQHELLSSL
jgi:beta-lactamase class A